MSQRSISAASRSLFRGNSSSSRLFSASAKLDMASTFTETSNQELNGILQRIQKQYILPALLPEKQRKIVFDPRKASYMQSNPIDLEIDGEEHRFAPMNLFKLQNSKKLYNEALKNMKTKEDWEQLEVLLSGYRGAGIILHPHRIAKAVRLAGMNGQIYSIIECAKKAQQTGLTFSNKEVMLRTLQFIIEKITSSDRSLEATRQAVKWIDLVLEVAERQQAGFLVQNSRLVRGILLYARASLVQAKRDAGEPIEEDLVMLQDKVEALKSMWKEKLNEDRIAGDLQRLGMDPSDQVGIGSSAMVWILAENIFAIRLARDLLGKEVLEHLDGAEELFGQYLKDAIAKETNEATRTRMATWHRRILGEEL